MHVPFLLSATWKCLTTSSVLGHHRTLIYHWKRGLPKSTGVLFIILWTAQFRKILLSLVRRTNYAINLCSHAERPLMFDVVSPVIENFTVLLFQQVDKVV